MQYRIMNPSSRWREVLDVYTDVIPDERGEPAEIAVEVDLVAIDLELMPDEKPVAEQVRCHLTRAQASGLMEGLRRAIEEVPPPS